MIRYSLKLKARDLIRRAGYDVRANNLHSREDLRLVHFLRHHAIRTVLDVGANRGQFAEHLLSAGFGGQIVSFEALPDVYGELQRNAARFPGRWSVAPRCALSDKKGATRFHITNNLQSSSMLAPNAHLQSMGAPLEEREVVDVDCMRLDELYRPEADSAGAVFLKIDVQGAEAMVLAGAERLLPDIKGLLLEMSLAPLYEGQPLAGEVDAMVIRLGFKLWDMSPVFRDAGTGRLYQYDAVYFKD